jgi:hypothetical protein
VKRNKFVSGIFNQMAESLGFNRYFVYLSLILVAVAILGLVYVYKVLIHPLGMELKSESFTPNNQVISEKETAYEQTSREETRPKQHEVMLGKTNVQKDSPARVKVKTSSTQSEESSGKTNIQKNTQIRLDVKPERLTDASYPDTSVSSDHAYELVEGLLNISKKNTKEIEQIVRDLTREGELAVSAIREFFDSGDDVQFAKLSSLNPEAYRLMKFALLDALNQIGGDEALEILVCRLQTTNDPEEIAYLANAVETHEPGIYRAEILTAAQKVLLESFKAQNEVGKNITGLATVFAAYGDESVVADLEKVFPRFKTLSMMALAELPKGEGIPSLIRIVEDPKTSPNDKNFAWRMLAQASRVSPEASQVLVDMAWSNQITSNDFIRIASTLGGREYRLFDKFDKQLKVTGSYESLPVTQSNMSAPKRWSDAEIDQRIELIDLLLETKPEPAVVKALEQAKDSLFEWRMISFIDGVRKK